jgi:NADH dehydrogenase
LPPSLEDVAVDIHVGDVRDPTSLVDALSGVDVVVSAMHGFAGRGGESPATVDRDGNANLVSAAEQVGARVVLVSIIGASADSSLDLFRMKHAAEVGLTRSSVPWAIVRASAFAELWIELLQQTAARSGRPLVFGRGDNPINFVSVADVASVIDDTVTGGAHATTVEVGGPDNMSFNELAALVGRGSTRHIPRAILQVMAHSVGLLRPDLARQARAALVMDADDMTWDATRVVDAEARPGATSIESVLAGANAVR